jgi:Na+-transporting methylmalonyl-CoA/oxaloacetate decarboxylase gamma subunit
MMTKEMRRAINLLTGFAVVVLVLFLLLFLLMVAPWLLNSAGVLFTGWVSFPLQIIPQMTIDWPSVATAGVAIVLFTLLLHVFLKWLMNSTRQATDKPAWRLRGSLRVVVLIVFSFVAGLSTVGIVHQITWMSTTDEKLLERDFWFQQVRPPASNPQK